MMKLTRLLLLALASTLLPNVDLFAKQPAKDKSLLTVDRIYQSDEFSSKGFDGRWLKDGRSYLRMEGDNIVRIDADAETEEVLVDTALLVDRNGKKLSIDRYQFSDDLSHVLIYTNSVRVWRTNSRGDYWVFDRGSRQCWQIGRWAEPSTLMFAKFSPDMKRVAYVQNNDVYVEDIRSGEHRKLTKKSNANIINGTFDWVYEEEFQVRDGFRWSPDSKSIAYWQLDTSGVPTFTMINNTDSLYPKTIEFAHPKPGQRNASCRVGVVGVDGGKTKWMQIPGDASDNYIARIHWSDSDSSKLFIQQLNRLQNQNRLFLADSNTGEVRRLLVERDEAWVDVHDEMYWLEGGKAFTWISDRDGWRHAYVVSMVVGDDPTTEAKLITPGEYDVIRLLKVDEKNGVAYFTASPETATESYLYEAKLDGSGVRRLTPEDSKGTNRYSISADASLAVHTLTRAGHAPVATLVRLPDHSKVRVIEKNQTLQKRLDELTIAPVEFFRVDIGDGIELDAWCIKPAKIDANKKYPLLVYVYGEPAGATVKNSWGGSGFLWHAMLAQKGYVVMSFDNRGTNAPRGRPWRKSIYRKIGVIAPKDQAKAVQAVLKERTYLDANRVGIWGWSGGGSSSLHAIFKYPEIYKTAISIASVPNQRYYDTIYQERYMGLPNDNVDGYTEGSPINFAKNLKGSLLVIHGTGDDNCHYQTFEMLVNELIRHNKQFSMMAYPNRTHSIREGKNTTMHLRQLMTDYLLKNL